MSLSNAPLEDYEELPTYDTTILNITQPGLEIDHESALLGSQFLSFIGVAIRVLFTIILGMSCISIGLWSQIIVASCATIRRLDQLYFSVTFIYMVGLNFISSGIMYLLTIFNGTSGGDSSSTNSSNGNSWILLWNIFKGHLLYALMSFIMWIPCSNVTIAFLVWVDFSGRRNDPANFQFLPIIFIVTTSLLMTSWFIMKGYLSLNYDYFESTVLFIKIAAKFRSFLHL